VIEPLPEQLEDVVVIQHVEDQPPDAARPHQTHAAQQAQLV
jgi:hypothetical protein